jgi:tetratricopeptide (TPR) repeat protein
MTNYASGAKLADLTLAGDPPAATPPGAAGQPPVAVPPLVTVPPPTAAVRLASSRSNDEYLAQAIQEFDAGTIDQPLWLRALDLSGNNPEAAKPAYLRARAAALWVAKRNQQADKPARHRRTSTKEEMPPPVKQSRRRSRSKKRVTLFVGAFGFVAMVVAGLLAMFSSNDLPSPTAEDTKLPPAQLRAASKPAAAKAGDSERVSASGDDFSRKVSDLKAAGNWNVLVLYAVEWARKAPTNADAWNELSMGYAKLRQFNEAQEAATKAAQLAPKNAQVWQNLGEINVMLRQPDAALSAYQQAVLLNERDVASLVQVGLLNAELGHLPEAKVALAHVLDMNPLDVDALCGAGSIAQKEGRAKDADAITRQLKAANLRCREATVVVPVAVAAAPAAAPAAKKKPASPAAR